MRHPGNPALSGIKPGSSAINRLSKFYTSAFEPNASGRTGPPPQRRREGSSFSWCFERSAGQNTLCESAGNTLGERHKHWFRATNSFSLSQPVSTSFETSEKTLIRKIIRAATMIILLVTASSGLSYPRQAGWYGCCPWMGRSGATGPGGWYCPWMRGCGGSRYGSGGPSSYRRSDQPLTMDQAEQLVTDSLQGNPDLKLGAFVDKGNFYDATIVTKKRRISSKDSGGQEDGLVPECPVKAYINDASNRLPCMGDINPCTARPISRSST